MLAVVACVAGCQHGPATTRRIELIAASIDEVEADGAYQCAPRELALARANLEFARAELEQGDPFRAEEHLGEAELNAGAARRLSPGERCGGSGAYAPVSRGGEDSDGDGIPDDDDRCPNTMEDVDGYLDSDGCADVDNDADGIEDSVDRCPLQPEDRDGFSDTDGCPDLDEDGDGVEDPLDRCPDRPGSPANQGCPRLKYKGAELTDQRIRITDPVMFEGTTATIRSVSDEILDTVATILAEHPEVSLEVQAHTDSQGDDQANLELSNERAQAVVEYLLAKGVDASRLTARGYGETRPIESNRTSQGRAINRRVEFVRTDQAAP